MTDPLPAGTVHALPADLAAALGEVAAAWRALTPLTRNEFICWIEDAKRPATRAQRIARTVGEIAAGKRRPCCWPGCIHRDDKPPGRWQQATLNEKGRRG